MTQSPTAAGQTPLTDDFLSNAFSSGAHRWSSWKKHFNALVDFARKLELALRAAEHNVVAYKFALGYPIPGNHNGKLSDGTTPRCGLCDAKEKRAAEERVATNVAPVDEDSIERRLLQRDPKFAAPQAEGEPVRLESEFIHSSVQVSAVLLGAWQDYADALSAALAECRRERDEAKRILHDEQAFAKAIVSNSLKDEMERMRERASQAESRAAAANAALRDAIDKWPHYLIDDYYYARWEREHAAAIATAKE